MEKMFKLDPPVVIGDTTITLLEIAEYGNGRRAVQLYSLLRPEDGGDGTATEPYDRLSVNLTDMRLTDEKEGFFAMPYDYHAKTYSAFITAGYMECVIGGAIGRAGVHGATPECRLTAKAMAKEAES